jgi:hypothetical protein
MIHCNVVNFVISAIPLLEDDEGSPGRFGEILPGRRHTGRMPNGAILSAGLY